MKFPLRYAAYEWVKEKKSTTDEDLLEALNKNGSKCSPDELDKLLMQLEILGLITLRWISKEKRRIEVTENQGELPRLRLNE